MGYLHNVEEAEEITQDVFVSIYKKAHTFKGNSKLSTWIYRITINKCLNALDKGKRRPNAESEVHEFHSIDFVHPGIILENQEKSKYLFEVIDTLVDSQKTAFILSYVEGLPRQEVADVMEIGLKAVESLLQRAKANLRKKLIDIYPEGNLKK